MMAKIIRPEIILYFLVPGRLVCNTELLSISMEMIFELFLCFYSFSLATV